MGTAKKTRKQTKMALMEVNHRRLIERLNKAVNNEGMLLRALNEVILGASTKYVEGVLVQMYGKGILELLNEEVKIADKKSKGLDKIILTGTEGMKQ